MKVIDTHAHIYSEDTARYPLCPDPYLPPEGKGTVHHMREEMDASGVERIVIVHTFTAYRWDNRLVADVVGHQAALASADSALAAMKQEMGLQPGGSVSARPWATGVCALDPNDLSSPDTLERYYRECGIRGLRVFPVEDGNGDRSFALPGHIRLWEKCRELGMVVCALINPAQIDTLERLLGRFADLPVVLDHCANLSAADAPDGPNLRRVLDLARFPNLYAKLSFLVTGSREDYPCRDTHLLARRIIDAFGPERCMWGSDFPCELWIPKASYAQHLRLFTQELGLDDWTQRAVLGETARRLWFR